MSNDIDAILAIVLPNRLGVFVGASIVMAMMMMRFQNLFLLYRN